MRPVRCPNALELAPPIPPFGWLFECIQSVESPPGVLDPPQHGQFELGATIHQPFGAAASQRRPGRRAESRLVEPGFVEPGFVEPGGRAAPWLVQSELLESGGLAAPWLLRPRGRAASGFVEPGFVPPGGLAASRCSSRFGRFGRSGGPSSRGGRPSDGG